MSKTTHLVGIVTVALGAPFAAVGCTRTYDTYEAQSPTLSWRLVHPDPKTPAFTAKLRHENGLLIGQFVPSLACRRALVREYRRARVRTTKPDYASVIAGVTLGGLAVGIGAAVYSGADHESAVETCSGAVHETDCASPRERQQTGAAAAMLLGGAVAAGAVATALGARNSVRHAGVEIARREAVRVDTTPVTCHSGPPSGLQVSIRHGDLTLGHAITNARGEFAFVLPDTFTGRIDVVLDGLLALPEPRDTPNERRIILSSPDG